MAFKLRAYQETAIARVLELFARAVRRVLLVLPTGGGKTVIAVAIIGSYVARGLRVLMLAHRRELIKQTFCKLVRDGVPPHQIGIIMAGTPWKVVDAIAPDPATLSDDELWRIYARRRPSAPIQVGSIDTFRNHVAPVAHLVIIDEAHRATAKSYCDVQLAYPDADHLGLTATPVGPNGKPLRPAYDEMVVACTFLELVELGALVEPICFGVRPSDRVDLRNVRRSGGDYKTEDLARAVDKAELVGNIVEHWRKYGNDAPTFAFAVNVAHSKHLAERFRNAGIAAIHVDGNTETNERDDAIAALREGRVKVLCNCDVFTEGTDVPEVKTIVLARPTLSIRLYLQQVGRGARPCGDTPFVVLDHAGCCRHPDEGGFGLPQRDRTWSLDGKPRRDPSDRIAPTKDCPGCYAMLSPATRKCPACGYEFPAPETTEPPEEKDGELVQLNEPRKAKPELTDKERRALAHWNEIVERWHTMNADLREQGLQLKAGGWCITTWRNETGRTWQPKGSVVPRLTAEELQWNATHPAQLPRGRTRPLAIFEDDAGNVVQVIDRPLASGALEEWSL